MTEQSEQKEDQSQGTDLYVVIRGMMAEIIHELDNRGHDHRWIVLGVNAPRGPRTPFESTSTNALVVCALCGLPQTVSLLGSWTEDQVRGKFNASSDTTTDNQST